MNLKHGEVKKSDRYPYRYHGPIFIAGSVPGVKSMDFVHNCVSLSVSCFHTCFSTFLSTTFLERRHAKINKQGPWAPGPLLTLPPNPLNSRPCDVGPLGKWYAGDHAIHTCSKWLGGMFIRLNHVSGMVQIRKRTFQMNTCTHLYIQDPSPPKWSRTL